MQLIYVVYKYPGNFSTQATILSNPTPHTLTEMERMIKYIREHDQMFADPHILNVMELWKEPDEL